MTSAKIAIVTLGCKTNQAESASLGRMLTAQGFLMVAPHEEADAYILNTCAVTAVSEQKSRQLIRRIRHKHPGALVAVCGCFPQAHAGEGGLSLPVDLIGGSGDRTGFVHALTAMLHGAQARHTPCPPKPGLTFERLPVGKAGAKTRAWLKIQDGCDNACRYCLIPSLRGPARSLPITDALAQAGKLPDVREIVLTGIEISAWGGEFGRTLPDVTETLCRALPDKRFRLGSLDPRAADEAFCARLGPLPNLCPHFHVALQSGCDKILSDMNRQYTTESYLAAVRRLRETFPGCALTTDLIVGFPGETDADFNQTLDFIHACRFAGMHVFPYSKRPATPAADRPDQVARDVKAARARAAAALGGQMAEAYRRENIGRTLHVLFEADGIGHSENYLSVKANGLRGEIKPVRVTSVAGKYVEGEPLY